MSLLRRAFVFSFGTVSNAILFIFHSRVVLSVMDVAGDFPTGPATDAINLLPTAIMLAIGVIQIALVFYFIAGLQRQRTVQRRPQP